jgi:hypothetical protein
MVPEEVTLTDGLTTVVPMVPLLHSGNHSEPDTVEQFPEPLGTIGNREEITLTFTMFRNGWSLPFNSRVKALLKSAKRSFGLKCTRITGGCSRP